MAPTTVTKNGFSPAAPRSWLSIVQCSLCHFIDMSHWPAMKTRIRVCVALSPFSRKSIKGFNKLWVTQQQWLKRADSGNQPKKVLQQQNAHSESTLRLKVFRFFRRKKPLGCDTDYGELRRWGCCSLVWEVKDGPSSRHQTENQSNSAHSIRPRSYISPSATSRFILRAWQHYHLFSSPHCQLKTHPYK